MGTFNNIASIFTDIGNALRTKMNVSDTFTPNNMAPAINNINTIPIPIPGYEKNYTSEGVVGTYFGNPENAPSFFPDVVTTSEYGNITLKYGYGNIPIDADVWEVTSAANLFYNNKSDFAKYNSIIIGNNVTTTYNMFKSATYFNRPVVIGNKVTNATYMFYSAAAFNQPIVIPDSVTEASYMFQYCKNFNQPIIMGNGIKNAVGMFNLCSNFNQPITINCINASLMFNNCINFNSPVILGSKITDAAYMFLNAKSFNQSVVVPSSVKNATYMFSRCEMLNSPITLGNGITDMSRIFAYCNNISHVIVPRNTRPVNAQEMFQEVRSQFVNIYFEDATNFTNVYRMFSGTSNKNIYCDNAQPFIKEGASESVTGGSCYWYARSDGNGYYSYLYNFNVFNNWTPT